MESIKNCGIDVIIHSISGFSSDGNKGIIIDLITGNAQTSRLKFRSAEGIFVSSVYACNFRLHSCLYEFTNSSVLKIDNSESVARYQEAMSAFNDIPQLSEYFISDLMGKAIFVLSAETPVFEQIE